MHKKSSEIFNLTKSEGWAKALSDAQQRLEANKRQREKIRNAIRIFEEKIKAGEPWPGDEKAGTAA
jgi:ribosomal protein S20